MVVDQKDALSVYFAALLREQGEGLDEPRPAAEAKPDSRLIWSPPVIAVPRVEMVSVSESQNEANTATATPDAVDASCAEPLAGGVPGWAEAPFQALLFKVSGLTLAVPLAELSGVQTWRDSTVTPMLGRIEWYLGLMSYRGRQVPVVDTAQLVLPPDRLANLLANSEERLGHVVFIQDGAWGLACDSVEDVISLDHDEVKWRSSRSKRRWLAGTVLEHMCAIIDPAAFAEMLRTGIADLPEEGITTTK